VLETVLFYVFALTGTASAVAVVSFKNPIHSTLSLLLTLFTLAGLFLLMQAPFVAVIHIAVYAGAIIILFLFVIMLMGINKSEKAEVGLPYKGATVIAAVALIFILGKAVLAITAQIPQATTQLVGGAEELGQLIFSKYLLPFE